MIVFVWHWSPLFVERRRRRATPHYYYYYLIIHCQGELIILEAYSGFHFHVLYRIYYYEHCIYSDDMTILLMMRAFIIIITIINTIFIYLLSVVDNIQS